MSNENETSNQTIQQEQEALWHDEPSEHSSPIPANTQNLEEPKEQDHHTRLIAAAYEYVSEDTKFVRLTTITTIIHSLIFLVYVMYSVYFVIAERQSGGLPIDSALSYIQVILGGSNAIVRLIIVGVILVIGYFLLPPIGEASMIHYLDNQERQWTVSLGRGFGKFFPMFEYDGLMSWFTPLLFFIVVSRFWVLGLIENGFVITILVLWWLIIFFTAIFLPYTKFLIVLEDMKPIDAMKKSMTMALENLKASVKYALINYLLQIRVVINIVIFLGVPALLIYGATQLNITNLLIVQYIIYGTLIILGLLTAYINGLIEAFFMTVRYHFYKKIK